jgi:protein-disulfide isomerase
MSMKFRTAAGAAVAAIMMAGCSAPDAEPDADANPPAVATADEPAVEQVITPSSVAHIRGADDAAVTVVELSDFGCPYCAVFARETYPALEREYIETGKVRWLYVPFVMGMFPNGDRAAIAAECATEQGEDAFWRMHDALYGGQAEWKKSRDVDALFAGYAAQLELDDTRFTSCYAEDRSAARVRAATAFARQAGVRATPTFFVNGIRVEGALPLEQFRMVLDETARRAAR